VHKGLLFGDPYHMVPSSEVDLDDDVETLEINDAGMHPSCKVTSSIETIKNADGIQSQRTKL
jgi:hypothetical protein